MEQIFMIEVFVEKLVLKIVPPEKDEDDLKREAEEKAARELAEAAAAALAAKGKKGKGAKGKGKGGKGKKGKEPPGPTDEELRFLQTCTVQMRCLPLFDFYIAHDNFIAPPPPAPPVTGKGKKGKAAKPKPAKGKKGKAPPPMKIILPSEPLPDLPYMCVGNVIMFISRPSKLEEVMKFTPISINVWNRDDNMNCIGFVIVEWDENFFNAVNRAAELNPIRLDAEYRNTTKPEMLTTTVVMTKPLQCEEDLKLSGEITFYVRMSALGNQVVSSFVTLPEMPMIPARTYVQDDLHSKDIEAIRNWPGTTIDDFPPIAYLFGAPDINREPIEPVEEPTVFEEYVAPFTDSELCILSMGFPKGPCGGTNCPKRLDGRGSAHQFIYGEYVKGKFMHGQFVNKRDVHGPCGRLDCPLAKVVRDYVKGDGAFKPCTRPCTKEYY